jgi:hypothetical protein
MRRGGVEQGGSWRRCGWKKGGFVAVMQLPLIPQHDQRKTKNNPKNGAANIVHGVSAIEGDVDEGEVLAPSG